MGVDPQAPTDVVGRALLLEWSLRTIVTLHRESPVIKGICAECHQKHPCITRLEATAHIDGSLEGRAREDASALPAPPGEEG